MSGIRASAASCAVCLFTFLAAPAATGAPRRCVGWLSGIQGRVEVQSGQQPARRVSVVALLWPGDVVTLYPRASAELRLHTGNARYALSGHSRVRVQPNTVQALQGPAPKRQNGAKTARALSDRLQPVPWTMVVRSGADARLGPRDPWPLFGVRTSSGVDGGAAPVTLRWSGPIDPAAVQQGGVRLRVLVREQQGDKTVLRTDLDPEARSFVVPPATLQSGRWYVWSVTLVGAAAGSEQACGGPLRLLTGAERTALERVEREADARRAADPAAPTPDLLRAAAYLEVGLLSDARDACDSALRFAPNDPDARAMAAQLREWLSPK